MFNVILKNKYLFEIREQQELRKLIVLNEISLYLNMFNHQQSYYVHVNFFHSTYTHNLLEYLNCR